MPSYRPKSRHLASSIIVTPGLVSVVGLLVLESLSGVLTSAKSKLAQAEGEDEGPPRQARLISLRVRILYAPPIDGHIERAFVADPRRRALTVNSQ